MTDKQISEMTDEEFFKVLADTIKKSKQKKALLEKPVSELTNAEMIEAVKAGRFGKINF